MNNYCTSALSDTSDLSDQLGRLGAVIEEELLNFISNAAPIFIIEVIEPLEMGVANQNKTRGIQ